MKFQVLNRALGIVKYGKNKITRELHGAMLFFSPAFFSPANHNFNFGNFEKQNDDNGGV